MNDLATISQPTVASDAACFETLAKLRTRLQEGKDRCMSLAAGTHMGIAIGPDGEEFALAPNYTKSIPSTEITPEAVAAEKDSWASRMGRRH